MHQQHFCATLPVLILLSTRFLGLFFFFNASKLPSQESRFKTVQRYQKVRVKVCRTYGSIYGRPAHQIQGNFPTTSYFAKGILQKNASGDPLITLTTSVRRRFSSYMMQLWNNIHWYWQHERAILFFYQGLVPITVDLEALYKRQC